MRRALAVAVCALALSGCGGEGDAVPGPLPSPTATEIPDRFPENFPRPPGTTQQELVAEARGGYVVRWTTEATRQQMETFYGSELRKGGWSVLGVQPAEILTEFRFLGHGWAGTVSVIGGTPVQILVVIDPAPTTG